MPADRTPHRTNPATRMLRILVVFDVRGSGKPTDVAMFVAKVISTFATAEVWVTRHDCRAYVLIPEDTQLPALQEKARALEAEYQAVTGAGKPYLPFAPVEAIEVLGRLDTLKVGDETHLQTFDRIVHERDISHALTHRG